MLKKILFIFFITHVCCQVFSQQNILSTRISYTAHQKPLTEVLKDIEKISQIRFSYNSDIISSIDFVTIQIENKSIDEALTHIFKEKFSYRVVGNQILIYESQKKTSLPITQQQAITRTQEPAKKESKSITDTIRIYDTIRTTIYDTIVAYEKIKIYDTLFVKMPLTISKKKQSIYLSASFGNSLTIPHTYSAQSTQSLKNHQNAEKYGSGNYYGILAHLQNQKLLLKSGVEMQNMRYTYSFSNSSYIDDGNATYSDTLWFWKYSKLFTYYKFNTSGDSVAIDVYDSTYTFRIQENPKKIEQIQNFSNQISLTYISIPLYIGYNFDITKHFSIEPLFILKPLLLISKKGTILSESQTPISINKSYIKPVNFSFGLACNTTYALQHNISLHAMVFNHFIPTVHTASTKKQQFINNFGFTCGILFALPYEIF